MAAERVLGVDGEAGAVVRPDGFIGLHGDELCQRTLRPDIDPQTVFIDPLDRLAVVGVARGAYLRARLIALRRALGERLSIAIEPDVVIVSRHTWP